MLSAYELTLLLAAVGSGLVAGLCFAFASFLMRAFDDLGASAAIRVMQSLNTRILRSSAMAVWFGTAVVAVSAAVLATILAEDRAPVITATVLYLLGAIAITGRGNVPLNEELDLVDPAASSAEDAWRAYRVRWGRWNAIRTVVFTFATAGFALAL